MPSATRQQIIDKIKALTVEEKRDIARTARGFIKGTDYTAPADLFHETVRRLLELDRHWPIELRFCHYMRGAMMSVAGEDRERRRIQIAESRTGADPCDWAARDDARFILGYARDADVEPDAPGDVGVDAAVDVDGHVDGDGDEGVQPNCGEARAPRGLAFHAEHEWPDRSPSAMDAALAREEEREQRARVEWVFGRLRDALADDPDADRVVDGWAAHMDPIEMCEAFGLTVERYAKARKRALRALSSITGNPVYLTRRSEASKKRKRPRKRHEAT